ncbi:MAG: hypothetical protein R2867_12060 [Caldilineaceae bacterium]
MAYHEHSHHLLHARLAFAALASPPALPVPPQHIMRFVPNQTPQQTNGALGTLQIATSQVVTSTRTLTPTRGAGLTLPKFTLPKAPTEEGSTRRQRR